MSSGVSNKLINVLLSWLKGLATWVLKLFNLAGSGGNPLLWLSNNWLKLLIILLIVGMAMDWIIWMLRWRPYWVWMKKKRIIINDESMLREEHAGRVKDQNYVVPSTVVHRSESRTRDPSHGAHSAQSSKSTVQTRSAASSGASAQHHHARQSEQTSRQTTNHNNRYSATTVKRSGKRHSVKREDPDLLIDDLFEVGHDRGDVSDFYEDEVFNVSNLPESQTTNRRTHRRHR